MCKNREEKDLLIEADKEFFPSAKRDIYYAALVKDIVKNNRSSQIMKCWFFIFVCGVFLFTCIVGMISILNISKKAYVSVADIGVAVTAFGSVLSSIIVLPQTIAKHLFPENSEQARFEFIRNNQKFDSAFVEDSTMPSEDENDIDVVAEREECELEDEEDS